VRDGPKRGFRAALPTSGFIFVDLMGMVDDLIAPEHVVGSGSA
jgi:hypothetical protein